MKEGDSHSPVELETLRELFFDDMTAVDKYLVL